MAGTTPVRLTRAQFLKRMGGVVGGAAVLGGASYGAVRLADGSSPARPALRARVPEPVRFFQSRPDLRPPGIAVAGGDGSGEYLLLGPSVKGTSHVHAEPGALICDGDGEPVWFRPVDRGLAVTDFKVSQYAGQPVLSWWQGKINGSGYGQGEGVIVDASYRRILTVRAGHGRQADLHELRLTPEGTALITCFPRTVEADLSAVGGPARGPVLENIIQEVDLRSARVLLEWRSLDHVPIADSYHPYHEHFDYLHVNSIDITPDGHLLISGRHTWALYKVHRRTGEVLWRLGGKRSDFSLDPAARFSWQHDAKQPSAGTITLFDDGSDGPVKTERQSRGLVLRVDPAGRRVRAERAYDYPHPGLLAAAMGSLQTLPGGNVLVGWGIEPYATEFDRSGRVVANVRMPTGLFSYRAFRYPWTGRPAASPAIAVSTAGAPASISTAANGAPAALVSWNGATEVTHWQLHLGPRGGPLRPGPIVPRKSFETAIPLAHSGGIVRAAALDGIGRGLGISPAITL